MRRTLTNTMPLPLTTMAEEVKTFVNTTFVKCIPKRKRQRISELYPRPNLPVTKVPRLDVDFRSAVGREQPDRQDQKFSKVQASVLATSAPLVKFWSHLSQQGITAKSDVAIPAGDVIFCWTHTGTLTR